MKPSEILSLRRRLGMNQTTFASVLGVTQVAVSGWERGAHSPREIQADMLHRLDKQLRLAEREKQQERYRQMIMMAIQSGIAGVLGALYGAYRDRQEDADE